MEKLRKINTTIFPKYENFPNPKLAHFLHLNCNDALPMFCLPRAGHNLTSSRGPWTMELNLTKKKKTN